ncbi:MAG: glucosaminidase domain-containing protein [Deltaproteobacteria bacterium]
MALGLDSSLAFRPNPGAAERTRTSEGSAPAEGATGGPSSAAFLRALAGATGAERSAPLLTPRHVAPTRTPLSGSQAADALEAAWQGAVGHPPSPRTLSILVGQWAHETGRGKAMLNYNFGGLKGTGPSGASTVYQTHEGAGASEIQVQDRFRAYDSAEQGASDYLSLLSRRYPDALQAAGRGDPVGFVQALKSRGYFTGDEGAYTKSVAGLAERALASGFDALGSSDATTPLAAAHGALPSTFASALEPPIGAPGPLALLARAERSDPGLAPGAYARSFADEIGRVELLMSALRIGQLDEKEG